ncbi:MAG: type II toxin-antitoxin system Phd/YefM family antitoxin [Candidatus Nanopelagicales bacterium]
MNEAIGIRALQQNASEVVQRAAQGETIIVTDRGRPVARLVPLTPSPLERLLADGLARPARRQPCELPEPLAASTGPSLGQILADARAQER